MSHHNPQVINAAMESIARRHADYLTPIQNTHSLAKTAADRLKVGGEIELLLKELGHADEPATVDWLQTQRQRLLQLGTFNDEMMDQVGTFVTAVRGLVNNDNNNETNDNNDDNEEATTTTTTPDYEQILLQGMQDQPSSSSKNHDKAKEIRSKLELPPEEQQEQDEEDQDLQVVGGSTVAASTLKCPLTGTLLENPVKNSVCGHAYSKEAILDHLRRRGTKEKVCPMVGCHNRAVTLQQLVPDLELTQLVRRQKRRTDANKEHRLSTQVLLEDEDEDEDDSDEEDDEENHDGNTTRAVKRETKKERNL